MQKNMSMVIDDIIHRLCINKKRNVIVSCGTPGSNVDIFHFEKILSNPNKSMFLCGISI